MGWVEIEEFSLITGVDDAAFADRDAALQAWSYVHRPKLVRRTTAVAEGGKALVVTLFSGDTPPAPAPLDDAPVAAFTQLVDAASYRRACYRDLG